MSNKTKKEKNPIVELLLCIFLGPYGAHRFYTGQYGTALLYLFTAGLFLIGWFVDIIRIIVRLVNRPASSRPHTELSTHQEDEDALVDEVIKGLHTHKAESAPVASAPINKGPVSSLPESKTKAIRLAQSDFVTKTYRVTGMQHYMDNIMSLSFENPDYDMTKQEIIDTCMTDEKIWKYDFHAAKTELVPEPDNPYDPNAVMVRVSGKLVGYIKAGSCKHILNLLKDERIKGIDCDIGGGPYKMVEEDEDGKYIITKGNTNFFVHLTIYENLST